MLIAHQPFILIALGDDWRAGLLTFVARFAALTPVWMIFALMLNGYNISLIWSGGILALGSCMGESCGPGAPLHRNPLHPPPETEGAGRGPALTPSLPLHTLATPRNFLTAGGSSHAQP